MNKAMIRRLWIYADDNYNYHIRMYHYMAEGEEDKQYHARKAEKWKNEILEIRREYYCG